MNLCKDPRLQESFYFIQNGLFSLIIEQISNNKFKTFIKFIENIKIVRIELQSHINVLKIKFYDLIYPDAYSIIKLFSYIDILKLIEVRLNKRVNL